MVIQNKIFPFKIKRQAKNLFPSDVEITVSLGPFGYVQTPDRAQLPDRTRFSVLWSFFLRYFILYAQLEEVYSIQNYFYLTPSFQYKKKRTKHNSTHIYIYIYIYSQTANVGYARSL